MNNNIAEKQEEDFTEVELESNNELEVDIVDDTPEADMGKPRRAEDAERKFQKTMRLQTTVKMCRSALQLKYEFHEERRCKEEASRLQTRLLITPEKFMRRIKSSKTLEEGEGVLVEQ